MALSISRSRLEEELTGAQLAAAHLSTLPILPKHIPEESVSGISSLSPSISFSPSSPVSRVIPPHVIQESMKADTILNHPKIVQTIQNIQNKSFNAPSEPSFDQLFHEIMLTLMEQMKGTVLTQKQLIQAEREWKEKMHQEMMKTHDSLDNAHSINKSVSKMTKFIGPLSLIATGAFTIATGGVSILAAGAVAIGGLLFCDTILDDAAKKTVAGWLSQTNGESKEAWLGRIHLFSSIASVATSFGLASSQAISIATNVSQVALDGIRTGVDMKEKTVRALLTEIEHHLHQSENMMKGSLASLKRISQTLVDFYKALHQVHQSTREAHLAVSRVA